MSRIYKNFVIGLVCLAGISLGWNQSAQAATVQEGDEGDRVLAVQLRLIDLGYNIPQQREFLKNEPLVRSRHTRKKPG